MRAPGPRALLLLAAALALPGCARWRTAREAEATVLAYDEALVVAYRTNDPRGLETVAGPKEVRKLIALIDLKRNANLALESRLEKLEVLGVDPTDAGGMTVRTRERWRYWDRALKPGMPAGQVFVADMWMTWTLERVQGRLRVAGGTTNRCDYLEPRGFKPGSGGPEHGHGAGEPAGREAGA